MSFYNYRSSVYIKAYILLQQGNMLNFALNNPESLLKIDVSKTRENFVNNYFETYNTFKDMFERAKLPFYRCDPEGPIDERNYGVTYTQLKKFDQAYHVNLKDVSGSDCYDDCSSIRFGRPASCEATNCPQTTCSAFYDCQNAPDPLYVCQDKKKKLDFDVRRYEYLRPNNKTKCKYDLDKFDSTMCTQCICFCDENEEWTQRMFNTKAQLADTDENEVVIGLRWRNHDTEMFSLDIQVGKLSVMNKIDVSTIKWVRNENPPTESRVMITDDYHTMIRDSTMDLDLLMLKSGYVMTGNVISFI